MQTPAQLVNGLLFRGSGRTWEIRSAPGRFGIGSRSVIAHEVSAAIHGLVQLLERRTNIAHQFCGIAFAPDLVGLFADPLSDWICGFSAREATASCPVAMCGSAKFNAVMERLGVRTWNGT